jgi:hypothetical protein
MRNDGAENEENAVDVGVQAGEQPTGGGNGKINACIFRTNKLKIEP